MHLKICSSAASSRAKNVVGELSLIGQVNEHKKKGKKGKNKKNNFFKKKLFPKSWKSLAKKKKQIKSFFFIGQKKNVGTSI